MSSALKYLPWYILSHYWKWLLPLNFVTLSSGGFFFFPSSPLGELNGSIQIKCKSAGCRSENLQHKRALSESLKTFLVIHLKRGSEGVSRHLKARIIANNASGPNVSSLIHQLNSSKNRVCLFICFLEKRTKKAGESMTNVDYRDTEFFTSRIW